MSGPSKNAFDPHGAVQEQPHFPSTEPRVGWTGSLLTALGALLTASVTAFLLLVNGSLVLVILESTSEVAPEWLRKDGVQQFILFCGPLLMVVVEWLIWDTLTGWLSFAYEPGDAEQVD